MQTNMTLFYVGYRVSGVTAKLNVEGVEKYTEKKESNSMWSD